MIVKQDGVLDLSKPAEQLEREVRAYLGWPGSHMVIAGKDVVVTRVHMANNALANVDKKTIFVANKQLCLQTADGVLVIDSLKPAGKSDMPASAFLAGYGRLL
jgi:methionyl-tRNA formyltransferase